MYGNYPGFDLFAQMQQMAARLGANAGPADIAGAWQRTLAGNGFGAGMGAGAGSANPFADAMRAMRPSKASSTKASGIRAMPQSRSSTRPSCRKRIAAKIAPVPQKALPRVNQSARWNSRNIEKWRLRGGGLPLVIADRVPKAR